MTTRPNLFDYATKELSQDAMICWLLEWAAKENQALDRDLAKVGFDFVNALLEKHDADPLVDVSKLQVWQQHQRIDVLAKINDTHVLLIEDKTDSADHSGQLERYYEAVRNDKDHQGANIYPIYFKTGNYQHSEKCRIEIEREHDGTRYQYRVFDRCDFLEVLEKYDGANANLTDFRDYLRRIQARTDGYKEWTKETRRQWDWDAWRGLFKHFEQVFKGAGWGYVPNPTGGFLGFWWGGRNYDNAEAYMQLQVEPRKPCRQHLCFKVGAHHANSAEQNRLKWECHQRVKSAGGDRVKKPSVMRRGKTMTVAQWASDWLAFDTNGKLDINETVSNLKEAESVLKQVCP